MQLNKYQERIIEIGKTKSAKLVLPERDDPRVSLAKRHLHDLGYELLEPEDFQSKRTQYQEVLEQERYFNKMTDEAKNEYGITTISKPVQGRYDAIVLAVAHDDFLELTIEQIKAFGKDRCVLYDIKYLLDADQSDGRL